MPVSVNSTSLNKTSHRWSILRFTASSLSLVVICSIMYKSNALLIYRSSFTQAVATCSHFSPTVDSFSTSKSRQTLMMMGKGDGKKKRKPKQKKSLSLDASNSPPPQRVTNNINIPIKQQIRWGKIKKEAAKASGQSFRQKKVVRTKYRRTWGKVTTSLHKPLWCRSKISFCFTFIE